MSFSLDDSHTGLLSKHLRPQSGSTQVWQMALIKASLRSNSVSSLLALWKDSAALKEADL